jgi:Ca2+-binding RTX toxin-like protein
MSPRALFVCECARRPGKRGKIQHRLSPGKTESADSVDRGSLDLSLYSLSGMTDVLGGNDVVALSSTQDLGFLFFADDGDDTLIGGTGNDTIFGEGGTGDVAIYDGIAADYSWTMIGANVCRITHPAPGAMDTIYNVEFLCFTGGGADVPI